MPGFKFDLLYVLGLYIIFWNFTEHFADYRVLEIDISGVLHRNGMFNYKIILVRFE